MGQECSSHDDGSPMAGTGSQRILDDEPRLVHRLVPPHIPQSIGLRSAIRKLQTAEDILQDFCGAIRASSDKVGRTQTDLRVFLTSPPLYTSVPTWAVEEKSSFLSSAAKAAVRELEQSNEGWRQALEVRTEAAKELASLVKREEKALGSYKDVGRSMRTTWPEYFASSNAAPAGGFVHPPTVAREVPLRVPAQNLAIAVLEIWDEVLDLFTVCWTETARQRRIAL